MERLAAWLDRIDPHTSRRIKGLRLVTAYGIAALMGGLPAFTSGLPDAASLGPVAAGFALWASVSEAQTARAASARDLLLLVLASAAGAIMLMELAPALTGKGWPGPELTLVSGAFCVGYLKRFGVLGAGIGSQIYIGQLLAYGVPLTRADLGLVAIAAAIAALASLVPRLLSGPAERPVAPTPITAGAGRVSVEMRMGLQAGLAALVIVILNDAFGLEQSAWAVTACTYVVAGTTAATIERVRRRILGTAIGVPLGLALLPLAPEMPLLVWSAAAFAMVIYAMALPERYDIACGAFAFALIVTLAASGGYAPLVLLARAWETLIGGAAGLGAALLVMPIRPAQAPSSRATGSLDSTSESSSRPDVPV